VIHSSTATPLLPIQHSRPFFHIEPIIKKRASPFSSEENLLMAKGRAVTLTKEFECEMQIKLLMNSCEKLIQKIINIKINRGMKCRVWEGKLEGEEA
jgi:hypothetical protein